MNKEDLNSLIENRKLFPINVVSQDKLGFNGSLNEKLVSSNPSRLRLKQH